MKHTYVSLWRASASASLAARGLLLLAGLALAAPAAGQGTVVPGPANSVSFGTKVTVLPNGNFVVADPGYSNNLGAVYLFRGTDGVRLGMLTGARTGD